MHHPAAENCMMSGTFSGTGPSFTVAAVDGRQDFYTLFGTGSSNTFDVTIHHKSQDQWARCIAYMSDATTMVVVSTEEGSGGTSTIDWLSGAKDLVNDVPAKRRADRASFDGVSLMAMARALGIAQFAGDRFADSFGALTYVDVAGATNLDTGTAGLLKPSVSGGGVSSGATPDTSSALGDVTFVDRSLTVANGHVVYSIGVYLTTAKNITVKIVHEDSTTQFDVLFSQAFSHPGGGWAEVVLSSPFTIPSADCRIGFHYPDTSSNSFVNTGARSQKAGDIGVGDNVTGWTAAGDGTLGVRYTEVSTANNLTVASTGIAAVAAPRRIQLIARVKHVDSAVAGTDYNFKASRNDGADFTGNLVLNDLFVDPTDDAHIIVSDPIDVSGQTSPDDMKWQFLTANNKMVELRDIYLIGLG